MAGGGDKTRHRALLSRLARDPSGNTIAMMAAMLLPIAALAGSTVDIGRLYLVKTRLQQACDSGVLAGRRLMVDSAATTLDSSVVTQATSFFTNNFRPGWLGTTSVTFTPTKTANNRVAGAASATVPMAMMQMFGFGSQTISVTCEARYDLADTDVIFVLDTTGSMACAPSDSSSTCSSYVGSAGTTSYSRPADSALGSGSGSMNTSVPGYPGSFGYYVNEKTGSRIQAVRNAVIEFYNTLAANVQPGTNIRYGFVTYTSTVNAGKAVMDVSPSYIVGGSGSGTTNWTYQSRVVVGDYVASQSSVTYTSTNQTTCNTYILPRNPSTALTYNSSGQASDRIVSWSSGSGGTCVVTTRTLGPQWQYQPTSFNISSFLTNATVDDPSRVDSSVARWQGCLEERDTTPGVSTFSSASLPGDLDPDLVPTSTATRWRPAIPEIVWYRNYNGSTYGFSSTNNLIANGDPGGTNPMGLSAYGGGYLLSAGWHSCGKPVRRLATMTLSDVTNYVNASDFKPLGGTYHDTGMIWGLRLLSPTGIFANDTAAWPGRNPPNRVIVFLTDGDMAPNTSIYGMYGIEYFDRRVSDGDFGNLESYHNARFLAVCDKAKSMNINIWTVSVALAATTEMQQCASSTQQALSTTSGTGLSDQFRQIALKVARLRVSQ